MSASVLNHWNGSDGSTTFTDEIAGRTWSIVTGTPELDTAFKFLGSASLMALVASSTIAWVRTNDFSFDETGSLTAEGRIRLTSGGGGGFGLRTAAGGNTITVDLSLDGENAIYVTVANSGGGNIVSYANTSAGLSAGTFYHVAVVRDVGAGTWSVFFNGTRIHQTASAANSTEIAKFDLIGYGGGDGEGAWFDETRLTDQVEYSGATYTPPSDELADVVLASIAAVEEGDTIEVTAYAWETFAGDAELALAADANLAPAEFSGDVALTFSGSAQRGVQGFDGVATLTLSMSGALERRVPSSVSSELTYSEIAVGRYTGEIIADLVKPGLEIVGDVDA